MALYTPEQRDEVARQLTELLAADERIASAELSGSGVNGYTDRWSDVDLTVTVGEGVDQLAVADDWIPLVYEAVPVLHHFAISFGEEHVRGFLLESLLELDIGFRPAVATEGEWPGPDPATEAGFAWHDVIHAAVAVARGRPWRAQYYVGVVRWRTLALATDRLGLMFDEFKGVDDLPTRLRAELADTLPRSLEPDELLRALRTAMHAFLDELRHTRPELADRLAAPLAEFVDTAAASTG
jgi:predicted nucleotidyltransferase